MTYELLDDASTQGPSPREVAGGWSLERWSRGRWSGESRRAGAARGGLLKWGRASVCCAHQGSAERSRSGSARALGGGAEGGAT